MSILEGNVIRSVLHRGGTVAGQPETIELHLLGGIVTLTNKDDIEYVNAKLREAKRLENKVGKPVDAKDYLRWCMIEDGIL